MGRFRLVALSAAVVATLAAGACSSSDPEISSGSTSPPGTGTTVPVGGSMMTTTPASEIVTADMLIDQTYVSTSVTGHELVAGSSIRMSFTATDLSVNAGCNTLGGSYSLDGTQLVLADDLRSTMMGCPEDLMAQDTWLTGWLASDLAIQATSEGIAVTGDGVTVELALEDGAGTPEATAASALVGPTWTVHTYVSGASLPGGGSSLSGPTGAAAATFTFADDGTVAVFTGCNSASSTYEVPQEGVIVFQPMGTPTRGCETTAAEIFEVAITTIASERATYSFEGYDLVLNGIEGSVVASPS